MGQSSTPSWLKSALFVVPMTFGALVTEAQMTSEFDRVIEFASAFSEAQSKFIHEGVRDQDPGALIWMDVPAQQVLVRAHVALDRVQLQAVVGMAGLEITYLGPPRIEADALRSSEPVADPEAPVYRNTGDPASDNARYEIEKKAWIEAYPERYRPESLSPEQER